MLSSSSLLSAESFALLLLNSLVSDHRTFSFFFLSVSLSCRLSDKLNFILPRIESEFHGNWAQPLVQPILHSVIQLNEDSISLLSSLFETKRCSILYPRFCYIFEIWGKKIWIFALKSQEIFLVPLRAREFHWTVDRERGRRATARFSLQKRPSYLILHFATFPQRFMSLFAFFFHHFYYEPVEPKIKRISNRRNDFFQ